MVSQPIMIEHIPAIVWGESSDKAYIFVHGKKSRKEEAQGFALRAAQRGFQTLSFDLPEHGSRQNDPRPCDVWNGVSELGLIGQYASQRWRGVSLFAVSLGAYFSLLAYRDYPLQSALFLSPILNMERLIRNMMQWFGADEKTLMEKRTISTPIGETLDWDYYQYVKAHPIDRWDAPTAILYGSEDNLTEREVAEQFAARFHADLTVLEGGEHYFHTEEHLAFLDEWLSRQLPRQPHSQSKHLALYGNVCYNAIKFTMWCFQPPGGAVMPYNIDTAKLSLRDYQQLLARQNLLPGRRILQQDIGSRFDAIERAGISNIAQLRKRLSTPQKLSSFAEASGLPAEYLTLLKRELGSLEQKSVPIADFPGLDAVMVSRLIGRGVKTSKDCFDSGLSESDELSALCDLVRINGVGPAAAKAFYEAGYRSVADVARADAASMLERVSRVNEEQCYYKARLGVKDMQFCIDFATLLTRYCG